ncbi:MAG TPA: YifB family Mg chelatase-like AAA ATPase, partial [Myxococcota bacterium]|nr:YifB family Mg chelatase-like AAA ATPase [Myxococcota bacterium]
MAVRVAGGTLQGVEAIPIEVEVDLLRRLPAVSVVGLAAAAVREAAERVRSAIVAAGCDFPRKRVVVNLAPADVRKDGCAFDLPIAVGVLAADGQVPNEALEGALLVGELSLAGRLRPVRGALSLAILARSMGRTLILPEADAATAATVPGASVLGAPDLAAVVRHLRGEQPLPAPGGASVRSVTSTVDMSEVRGQALARRAVEIAASGAHHCLLLGGPGCGKSMISRRLPTILPPLSFEEALEVTRIHGAAGLVPDGVQVLTERPFRAPHHSVTPAGLVGDRSLRPGEVSLAHHGVLFLDEAPEFRRSVLEVLRGPLEDRVVQLTRAEGTVVYPAAITLVLAANPCPCGLRGTASPCACTDHEVRQYRRRLSGPILDRVDLHVEMEPIDAAALLSSAPGESSSAIRDRVLAARARQAARG